VLEAFDTLANPRDFVAAERLLQGKFHDCST
jgi:hypothetical protein